MTRIARLVILALFILVPAASAKLCEKCKGMMVVMMMGKCKACKGTTSSASYKYCKACATKKGACDLCGKGEVAEKAKDADIVTGNNACALDLYTQLKSKDGNVLISPYSISSAMAMTYAGARGKTAKQMAKALHVTMPQKKLPSAFKALNDQLVANAKKSGQKLSIANGLCLTGGDVSREFKAILKESYGSEIFKGDLPAINGWVKKKTEGKIDKILDSLSANSVCVLLNAIYFKGTWEGQFDKKRTHQANFKVSPEKTVKVPMMYQKAPFRMLTKKGFQMVSMPYKGGESSMVVLLPQAADGLATLEKQVTADALTGWLKQLDARWAVKTMLFLPKFTLKTEYDLVPACKALGMSDAFSMDKADFSGMGWKKGALCIAQIKHKAVIEVNEEGAEAAAATAVEMATKSERRYPTFRADHPFMFLIRDNQTGSILFIGRVVDPK